MRGSSTLTLCNDRVIGRVQVACHVLLGLLQPQGNGRLEGCSQGLEGQAHQLVGVSQLLKSTGKAAAKEEASSIVLPRY